jgi:hypothetical protein
VELVKAVFLHSCFITDSTTDTAMGGAVSSLYCFYDWQMVHGMECGVFCVQILESVWAMCNLFGGRNMGLVCVVMDISKENSTLLCANH